MQVSNPNDVKIYNLSAGKSLPEWLSDRKKRQLQKKDVDIRRRVTLMQDFEMPTVSNCMRLSRDGKYLYTSGVYKPRIRCYDVAEMSMKFERCVDSEVVKMHLLSDDYSKLILLQSDRYLEFHAQFGRYYRTRVPKFGRDIAYLESTCEVYVVGVSPEIYRMNLEQGRFMNSIKTEAKEINCCEFNPDHYLFSCGTSEGKVECWDPRDRTRAGILDCAEAVAAMDEDIKHVPAIKSLKYRDALNFAVGTDTGQILLYDIRSSKPLVTKDHMYGLPIKSLEFHRAGGLDLVMSMDKKILKLWSRQTGKAFTSIEPGTDLNDLCVCDETGLFFMANEAPKMLAYFVPALGPAPKWCAFLDNLTEELEESNLPTVYDDYKFVTRKELDELGLTHLIGSNLLRAYMHGYFLDMRLYHKAKSIVEPFAYDDYRKQKIREKIDKQRSNRVIVKKLPKVNKALAAKLLVEEQDVPQTKKQKKQAQAASNLLKDSRFTAMFENPDFEVDTESAEYKLLNPVVSKIDKQKQKKQQQAILAAQFEEVEEGEEDGRASSDEESSSDDDQELRREFRKQHRLVREQQYLERRRGNRSADTDAGTKVKFMELKSSSDVASLNKNSTASKVDRKSKSSFADRLKSLDDGTGVRKSITGGHEMTFTLRKSDKEQKWREKNHAHHVERRKIRRSAGDLPSKKPTNKYWMGKRVT
ncbi:nucleolar protein 10-like [Tubulanus polymorphus]|uniref:nucleolar protein 10-like n=1 Tax=Tubulanus polymorphus TaxID=672921 RepID=UPI003DA491E6